MTTNQIDNADLIPFNPDVPQVSGAIFYGDKMGESTMLACPNLSAIRTADHYQVVRGDAERLLSIFRKDNFAHPYEAGIIGDIARALDLVSDLTRMIVTEAVIDSPEASIGEIMLDKLHLLCIIHVAVLDHVYHKWHGSEPSTPNPTEPVEIFTAEGIVSYQQDGFLLARNICDLADTAYTKANDPQSDTGSGFLVGI